MFEKMGRLHPIADGQRVALRPRRLRQHRRGEHHPRQVAHLWVAQLAGQVVQIGEHSHGPSIAFYVRCRGLRTVVIKAWQRQRVLPGAAFRP